MVNVIRLSSVRDAIKAPREDWIRRCAAELQEHNLVPEVARETAESLYPGHGHRENAPDVVARLHLWRRGLLADADEPIP